MSPTLAASQLRSQIYYHLDADLLESANFLAGRLHALEPRNPDSHHLLALTYLRLRRFKAAYDFSQKYGANGRHLGCAYVFAQSCLQVNKYTDGAAALERARGSWMGKSHGSKCSEVSRRHLPDAAACWTIMGKLWQAHGDLRKAGDCFIEAHKANPFLWNAFEGLCKVGADLNVSHMFKAPANMLESSAITPDTAVATSGAVAAPTRATEIYSDDTSSQQVGQIDPISSRPLAPQLNFNQQVFTPSADPFSTNSSRAGSEALGGSFVLPNPKNKAITNDIKNAFSEWDTPTTNSTILGSEDVSMSGVIIDHDQPPAAPARKNSRQQFDASERVRPPALRNTIREEEEAQQKRPSSQTGGHKRTISGQQPASQANNDAAAQPRRSNRLFGQSASTKATSVRSTGSVANAESKGNAERPAKAATGTKGRIGSTVGRVVSGNRKLLPPDRNGEKEKDVKRAPSRNGAEKGSVTSTVPRPTKGDVGGASQQQQAKTAAAVPTLDTSAAEREALTGLLDSFRELALGTYSTTRFDTSLAIRTFRSLPSAQRETPWVLSQLGKAYYEGGDYHLAEDCFARVLKLQPSRIEDMEVYSTVLWHLKKDSALAFLCYQLRDVAPNAPQTWVAVGNAFSLSREHDQAISAFKRATQVDEHFAYAWTLMGHEYIANEAFDQALSSFRRAVAVDRRGYGGWYGLGKCYERMGRLEESEKHYRIAASINPANATLLVCIGVVLERLRNRKGALANYTRALELQPNSALARFKKARVLMHLRYFAEALVELEVLRDQAPDEANVWFLLGKCYKGLGDRGEALRALTTALNLDVKAAPFIKEAMEALDEDEEEGSDDD